MTEHICGKCDWKRGCVGTLLCLCNFWLKRRSQASKRLVFFLLKVFFLNKQGLKKQGTLWRSTLPWKQEITLFTSALTDICVHMMDNGSHFFTLSVFVPLKKVELKMLTAQVWPPGWSSPFSFPDLMRSKWNGPFFSKCVALTILVKQWSRSHSTEHTWK